MAKKQSKPGGQSNTRAQGGGRTSNTEPRMQVFQQFGGCNFQYSPHAFSMDGDLSSEQQSDLQMNYFSLQNNAGITTSKTIETRNNIIELCKAPSSGSFTDASVLIGNELYIALDDGRIAYYDLDKSDGREVADFVTIESKTGAEHHWECLDRYDDKLIGATSENELFTGDISSHTITNAKEIPNPSALSFSDLVPKGTLTLSESFDDDHAYRTDVAYTYVNKYGPTMTSDKLTFYSNTPASEWSSACYLQIKGTIPTGYDIKAVELYYSADNASSLIFMGRTDVTSAATSWVYNWVGYLDATSMWPTANLTAPEDNYTKGAPVSRMCNIDGRMYFWGCEEYPYRLYIGGNPGNLFSVSSGTGGGYVDVEPGSGQEIRYVAKYKTQSGSSIVTLLCASENDTKEQRFNLVENTITVSNEQSMKSWQAEQVSGAVGCKSYHGAKVCEDGLYAINRYGLALTTMTMEYNSQIRTNYVSDAIKPVFTDTLDMGRRLKDSVLLELDGIIYIAFGTYSTGAKHTLDNLLFCYDIDGKAWWTYSIDIEKNIIDMIHVDYEQHREGIGLVCDDIVYLLPTTGFDMTSSIVAHNASYDFLMETADLSTQIPMQGWHYLCQIEFRFDYFLGDMDVDLIGVDMFGRTVHVHKDITHETAAYDVREYMRVDLRLQSYKLKFSGRAKFRMTHFMAKVYTMSNRMGLVWGFDDSSVSNQSTIHPYFKDYNDIRKAIIN